jgi:dGTPase
MKDRLQAMNALLSPLAVPLGGTLGREKKESDDETRFPFQRDRDRIVHTDAFRRLKGKTQVFVAGVGDHYRTRLTHTMEVAQIARDMARTLELNEDLAECIALAHDLGHPPFGHMGETALDAWMKKHGGHFEHNEQSLRIVTVIEQHRNGEPGLNLNREILEGMQKHVGRSDRTRALSLEAQAVNIADEIAYVGHDCDDGLRAELFSMKTLSTMPLTKRAVDRVSKRGTSLRGAVIVELLTDCYAETERRIKNSGIQNLDDVYAAKTELIGFSETMQTELKQLRTFLFDEMYSHPRVREAATEGQGIVTRLCDALFAQPSEKILELQKRTSGTLPEAVKDYVAGMTDAYARSQEGV